MFPTADAPPSPANDRRSASRALGLVAGLLTLSLGCATKEAALTSALRVEFAACAAVLDGPTCIVSDDWGLRLWVGAPTAARVAITVDGRTVEPTRTDEVHGGLAYVLPPVQGEQLTVEARTDGTAVSWSLALATKPARDWERDMVPLIDAQDFPAMVARLRRALAEAPDDEHGLIRSLLLRVDHALTTDQRESMLQETIRHHRAHQRLSHLVDDSTMLAWIYLRNGWRVGKARAVLDGLDPPVDGASTDERPWPRPAMPAETNYYLAYYRGLLADATGDLRRSVFWVGRAARQAARVGFHRKQLFADQLLAQTLRRAGQHAEAADLLADLEARADSLTACDRALIMDAIAWDQLLARELGQPADDPTPRIEQALALYREGDCPDTVEAGNMLINLALSRLQSGNPEAALRHLEEARALEPAPPLNHLVWWQDIAARVALRQGRPAMALGLYDELENLATTADSADARWRAAYGRAQTLERLDRPTDALAAYHEAERRLDEASLGVPIHLDRAQFAAPREPATRRYLDLLLRHGQAREALAVLRRARVRSVRGLVHERQLARLDATGRASWDQWTARYRALRDEIDASVAEDWRLPADQRARALAVRANQHQTLRDLMDSAYALVDTTGIDAAPLTMPPPGEVFLAFHPLPTGWVALAHDEHGVAFERIADLHPDLPAADLAARLLMPFAATLSVAQRIRILPYGFLRHVDFHALPFGDGALLDTAAIVYGLDLPTPAPASRSTAPQGTASRNTASRNTASRTALVVADPIGNLPQARTEADEVAGSLRQAGWQVDLLHGVDATADRLRAGLAHATLFHFAGHGSFAAEGPWDSALTLARGARLTLGDVLALPQTPERVMLLACESGRSGPRTPGESALGLAQAFLTAGSSRVLASLRPVGDATAAHLARTFYDEVVRGSSDAEALRRAQQALRHTDPEADWASFRLLVR